MANKCVTCGLWPCPHAVEVDRLDEILTLASEGLYLDGAHHKQWSLEQIILALRGELPDDASEGIAP